VDNEDILSHAGESVVKCYAGEQLDEATSRPLYVPDRQVLHTPIL
jgi:hypothetical protein